MGNYDRLRLLAGAAGVVLGDGHPTTQAVARAITTWQPSDVVRARTGMRRLDLSLRVLLPWALLGPQRPKPH